MGVAPCRLAGRGRVQTGGSDSSNVLRCAREPRHHTFSGRGCCCSAGFQLRGPSRVAGFPLVGFGAKVASGSNDSTMAISSPGSRSEARAGRR
jgi:hypothetical protein